MKLFRRSYKFLVLILLSFVFVVSMQNSFANTTLEVSTTNMGDTLYFSYEFNFSTSSPSSIIAIEKPEDSIFVNAFDNEGVEYEPLVIGDFYRFELNNRDINSYTIQFTSAQTLRDIYEKDEQTFYVNSNVDLDQIIVSFDVTRPFNEVLNVYPRNYEVSEDETRITTLQEGSLDDNLFRISYESTDSMSIWIFVLLSIPILFFVILYISLKAKPHSKDKNLGDFIRKDSENEKNNSNNKYSSNKATLPTSSNSDENIVYSFGNEDDNNNIELDDQELEKKVTVEKRDQKLSSNEIRKENKSEDINLEQNKKTEQLNTNQKDSLNITSDKSSSDNVVGSNELEEYIQKYFTENEQDVIRVISNNEGLMQQEILDNLPIFTKSTLSKILSKLEKKKMIERVRVGKVNKLFIGEELKKLIKNEKEEDKSEEDKQEGNNQLKK